MILAAAENFWLGLGLADWAVLAVYFVVILAVGIWSARRVKDMADFFMGGRRFGKVFMMFFAFGAGTSSEQAIGVVAGTWRVGLAGIWWQFLWLWATPFYWIVAPIMRRMRALTTADFFETRYNPATATLYSLYGIAMAIVFIAGGLFGSGKMVDALTGGELNVVAERLDIDVPKAAWDTEKKTIGPGILFETSAEHADALQQQTFPDELRGLFLTQERILPEQVTVNVTEADTEWQIVDAAKQQRYRALLLTTEQVREGEDGEKVTEVTRTLRVYGSGWRRLKGFELAILAMTLLFVVYGMAGGLGAAIVTDFIQGVLTITFSFLLLPFVFAKIGGFGSLSGQSGIKEGMLELVADPRVAASLGKEPITIFYVLMLSLTALAGIVAQPHIMGVCGAGKTEFEGRFGFTVGNFLKRFCTVAWTFTGLACIVWYLGDSSPLKHADVPTDQESAEFEQLDEKQQEIVKADRAVYESLHKRVGQEAYSQLPADEQKRIDGIDKGFADKLFGRAAYEILPTIAPGLVGLLLASLLAAVMSTSDAQMIISSGLFTENIYRRWFVKKQSQKHYLWVGRIAGLLIVMLALILQSTFTDVIDALKVILKTPAFIGVSLWFGITWRRWNTLAVWVSTAAGIGCWLFVAGWGDTAHSWGVLPDSMFTFGSDGKVEKMTDAWQMASFMSVTVLSGVLVSLITRRQSKEKLDHFYSLMHTPITPGEVVATPCTLPENPAPQTKKMFKAADIELQRPTLLGLGGFILAWCGVAGIIWLTQYLAQNL